MHTSTFSSTVRDLLSQERLFDLGPGSPNESAKDRLKELTVETLFAPERVRHQHFAQACLSGLWLYHDFLDESHALSQDIASAEGSFWHGIVHRREPDYSNAAYWFRRVGRHAVFHTLGSVTQEIAAASQVKIAIPSPWDPFWFIGFCEACHIRKEPGQDVARLIQKREWELLFEHCYRGAVG
jgi:hypothetical protein